MGGYNPPPPTREVAMGDKTHPRRATPPPTLRKPGEPVPAGGSGKVQFPNAQPIPATPSAPQIDMPSPQTTPSPRGPQVPQASQPGPGL